METRQHGGSIPPTSTYKERIMARLDRVKEDSIGNGIYKITKIELNDRIFGDLLVKGGFYVTISDIDVEVTKEVFSKLKDGQEVCVVFPSVYYQKNGRPTLLKEF